MRQEVYKDYIKRQRRREETWKRQRMQQIQRKPPSHNIEEPYIANSGWTSYLPGWVTGVAMEEELQRPEGVKTRSESSNDEAIDIDMESQFWELAKDEGDEKYFDWLQSHVWTVRC
jgi:ABC-type oligopeptide transport system ATPase subunit